MIPFYRAIAFRFAAFRISRRLYFCTDSCAGIKSPGPPRMKHLQL